MLGGLLSVGLGAVSSLMGSRGAKTQGKMAGQGYDYMRKNSFLGAAQNAGEQALSQRSSYFGDIGKTMGLQGDYFGLGGQAKMNQMWDLGGFEESPAYQHRLNEGMKGLLAQRATAGILNSGATAKAVNAFAQGTAAQEYSDWYQREMQKKLAQIQGLGQIAGQQTNLAQIDQASIDQNKQLGLSAALGIGQAGESAGLAQAQIHEQGQQNMMSGLGGIASGIASMFGF